MNFLIKINVKVILNERSVLFLLNIKGFIENVLLIKNKMQYKG